jgi:thiopurine S-methyltransferase
MPSPPAASVVCVVAVSGRGRVRSSASIVGFVCYVRRMEADFWRGRWREGQIGFHEGKPNAYLVAHGSRLAGHSRVLVPLCGKAEDLAELAAHGHDVIGVELVEDAVKQFFAEHGVEPEVSACEDFAVYRAPLMAASVTIYAGDYFATTASLVGRINAVYDRAALVELPREMRARYVEHTRAIAPGARTTLLVSLEYDPDAMPGPPFSVDEAEVRRIFVGDRIELLGEGPDPRGRPLTERCYLITRT